MSVWYMVVMFVLSSVIFGRFAAVCPVCVSSSLFVFAFGVLYSDGGTIPLTIGAAMRTMFVILVKAGRYMLDVSLLLCSAGTMFPAAK